MCCVTHYIMKRHGHRLYSNLWHILVTCTPVQLYTLHKQPKKQTVLHLVDNLVACAVMQLHTVLSQTAAETDTSGKATN
jgi:hypothetical protein